ncbi:MAG: LacI family transcriptional regulator [Lachnospiraceae bacterium]|nr:LacI family transcriptional regulator [Lachnospiraceae bacterium]
MAKYTIRDIAHYCNVSISTVSRAINNDPTINKETRDRILDVVEKFNYVPNNSARNLKMSESNTVALLVKGLHNPFFQGMFDLFENGLKKKGYDFLLYTVLEDQNEFEMGLQIAKEKRLKGVIFLGGKLEKSEYAKELSVPFVLCSVPVRAGAGEGLPIVSIDDEKESYRVVDYLIKKGHKRIAIITGKHRDMAVGSIRLSGYRKAFLDNGIQPDEALIRYMRDDLPEYSEENGYMTMKELLDSGASFSAVFVISDRTTIGAYKAIYDAGKRIPEDYSVVGFDGIEMTKYMYPALTTMVQPVETMVSSSIDLLMRQIAGEDVGKKELYEATLIERESVKKL